MSPTDALIQAWDALGRTVPTTAYTQEARIHAASRIAAALIVADQSKQLRDAMTQRDKTYDQGRGGAK